MSVRKVNPWMTSSNVRVKDDRPLVTVCIPTANLGERSLEYLDDCLSTIEEQDYPRILTIISDHSTDNDIERWVTNVWQHRHIRIIYHRNENNRGNAAANMNQAVGLVPEGSLIKMLFQDDFLSATNAISKMVACIQETGAHWLGVGCDHINDEGADIHYSHPPGWISDIGMAHGHNLIGSPSVVMFRKTPVCMDTSLKYLNDCEFYYRMGRAHGAPALLTDLLVTIRMRSDGLSSTMNVDEVKARESLYLQKKFGEV